MEATTAVSTGPSAGRLSQRAAIGVVLLAILSAGCGGPDTSRSRALPQAVDPVRLGADLRLEMDRSLAQLLGTATEVAASSTDRRVWENALRLKILAYNSYLAILAEEDPRAAFVSQWLSTVQFRQYVTEGAGKAAFGTKQAMIVDLMRDMEADVLAFGRRHFPPETIAAAQDDIEEAARSYSRATNLTATPVRADAEAPDDIEAILTLPMLPVTGLKGVSDTPAAINRFTDTAQDFAAVVKVLPEMTRWQVELLLLEMESSGPAALLGRKLDGLDETFQGATKSVEALPVQIRTEFEKSLDALTQAQTQTGKTLADARAGVDDVRKAVAETRDTVEVARKAVTEFRDTAEVAARTSDQFTQTGKAFQQAAVEVRGVLTDYENLGKNEAPKAEKSPGVEDYRVMADSVGRASQDLRSLLADLRQPMAEQGAFRQASDEARSLADAVFWRAAALLVLLFGLAVAYRLITKRTRASA